MPYSKFSVSPFTSSFTTAIKNGTPCWTAINNISRKTGKSPKSIISSLRKAGVVHTQTFHGQPVCWPAFPVKTSRTNAKTCQYNQVQWFISWCLSTGIVTPRQFTSWTRSPATFVSNCRKIVARQFAGTSGWSKTRVITPSVFSFRTPTSFAFSKYARTFKARYRKAA